MGEPKREDSDSVENSQRDSSGLLQQFDLPLEEMRRYDIETKKKGKDLENVRLRLAYPQSGLPTSFEETSKLISDTEDMLLFFAPETRNNKIEYISRAAIELYGFTHDFPDGNTAGSTAFKVANFYIPEDTKIYAPRQEFSKQQYMLGKLAEGGLYQLPDLLLILNQRGRYVAVRSQPEHLFSKDNEFFGTLISLQASDLSEKEYHNAKTAKQLVTPTPQDLFDLVMERRSTLLAKEPGRRTEE